jgi:DNA-binding response OmpR family regulator
MLWAMARRGVRTVLLVLRDPLELGALGEGLRSANHEVIAASRREEAVDQILLSGHLDFVVVAPRLDDGSGLDVARTATLSLPTPHVLAVEDGLSPAEAFQLGSYGVHSLLPAPLTVAALIAAFDRVEREAPPPIYALLARYVGRVSLLAFEREVRRSLLIQALDRSGGSRTAAARLLRTSRQMIQKVANHDD